MTAKYLSETWAAVAPAMGNHLWQSTLFAALAGLLTLLLRKNQARARYWIWMAASLKFLVPFSLLVGMASNIVGKYWLRSRPRDGIETGLAFTFDQISQPFTQPTNAVSSRSVPPAFFASVSHFLPVLLSLVWICGFMAVLLVWLLRWRRVSIAVREATRISDGREVQMLRRLERAFGIRRRIEMCLSQTSLEPGIFGIVRPVLIWPRGISERLDSAHAEAILSHEVRHVRRRDNLFAAVHMLVEAIFWFHPLLWYLGTRLVEEREIACDEEVLDLGSERQIYAESILKVCEFCVGSPLACVSGVTGSDLKKRIVRIMSKDVARKLNSPKKVLLGAVVVTVFAVPLVFGLARAPQIPVQSQDKNSAAVFSDYKYEVASFKVNKSGPGRALMGGTEDGLTATNFNLLELIGFAYGLETGPQDGRIAGAPGWLKSEAYDVEAKMDASTAEALKKLSPADQRLARQHMLRELLAERCGLVIHRESRDLPVFALVIAKNGSKLEPAKPGDASTGSSGGRGGRALGLKGAGGPLIAHAVPISDLVQVLSMVLNRPVVDRTGLADKYDFTLHWTPDENQDPSFFPSVSGQPPDPGGPSLFSALQEQLGLKLESGKGPLEVIVIDHVEKPSGN